MNPLIRKPLFVYHFFHFYKLRSLLSITFEIKTKRGIQDWMIMHAPPFTDIVLRMNNIL